MNRETWLIASLIGVSVISALADGLYYWSGAASTPATPVLANVFSALLIASWIDTDSKHHPQVGRSFDYGFLVLMFCLPYLPYYLWRTRGVGGLFMLAGFLGLFLMGFFVQLLIYGLSSP
jgi:hypothetical protein